MKTDRFNEPTYFKCVLTSKFKLKDVLLWDRSYAFVSIGNERPWIHSWLRKIRFAQGRPPLPPPPRKNL